MILSILLSWMLAIALILWEEFSIDHLRVSCLDMAKFPNMAVVLKEIERQRNLKAFDAIAPDTTALNKKLRRTSLVMSKIEPPSTKRCNLGRQISNPNGQSRHRIYSVPCPSTDDGKPKLRDPRLNGATGTRHSKAVWRVFHCTSNKATNCE